MEKELEKTADSPLMMDTSHRLDSQGNLHSGKIPYRMSEVRLIEAMEKVCSGMFAYDLQTDDESAFRYHRKRNLAGMSKLMEALSDRTRKMKLPNNMEALIDPKGHLGVLKTKCNILIEEYEDDITEWYQKHQESTSLTDYLCAQRAVKDAQACLSQKLLDKLKSDDNEDQTENDEEGEEIDADKEDESNSEQSDDEDDNESEVTGKHSEL